MLSTVNHTETVAHNQVMGLRSYAKSKGPLIHNSFEKMSVEIIFKNVIRNISGQENGYFFFVGRIVILAVQVIHEKILLCAASVDHSRNRIICSLYSVAPITGCCIQLN